MERSCGMKMTRELIMKLMIFLITAGIALVFTATPYAANDLRAPRGESGYASVTGIDENYISCAGNRYVVTKETTIHDEDGKSIPYAEIKRSSMVSIIYKRANGQLIAVDIVLRKFSSKKEPE
jgi:hypothetical protein